MKKKKNNCRKNKSKFKIVLYYMIVALVSLQSSIGQTVTKEKLIKISTNGLYFDGVKVDDEADVIPENNIRRGVDRDPYHYWFGTQMVADGDCITAYNGFVFMAWYKGDKNNRYIQVSRYNPKTGKTKTFQLNWQHTGFRGNHNIGESHNTIAIGISPKDKTMHLLYDMHAYSALTRDRRNNKGEIVEKANPGFFKKRGEKLIPVANRYFRYSFSLKDVTKISDNDWTQGNVLERAVNNNEIGNYTHNSLNGRNNPEQYEKLTYPKFFLNENNDLFFQMRAGGNTNGSIRFYKYNAARKSWGNFKQFNVMDAKKSKAIDAPKDNWGLYGDVKFLNGKISVGFQRRSGNEEDKYSYQDGFYLAISKNADGTQWQTVERKSVPSPVVNPDSLKIHDPEELLKKGGPIKTNSITMSGPNDFTITERGDIHMIARVVGSYGYKNPENETIYAHSYKPVGKGWKHEKLASPAERIFTFGNDIYTVGLNNSRKISIQKSVGGTNNFEMVYEEGKDDKSYRNGTARIIDGKVYYYAMAIDNKMSGSRQPLYLNIIDLGLKNTDNNTDDITKTWFTLKNVYTKRYLDSDAKSLVTGDSDQGYDKQWRFVKSGNFYNIESRKRSGEGRGVLRALRSNRITGTNASPTEDADKQWTVKKMHDGSYRIKSRTRKRYIQNNFYNTATLTVSDLTNRTKWILEPQGSINFVTAAKQQDSIEEAQFSSLSIYPNPSSNSFSISLLGTNKAEVLITDMFGKLVYSNTITSGSIEVSRGDSFASGLYLVTAVDDTGKVLNEKLVIK